MSAEGFDDGPLRDGLADLLTGARPPGVYRWHAQATLPTVRDRVESDGWRFAHLAGWTSVDRPGVLRRLGRALDFASYYGQNLDALADCLCDLVAPTVLVWDHWARFARADEAGARATLAVLAERTAGVPAFAVLLWGEGPPTGFGSLD